MSAVPLLFVEFGNETVNALPLGAVLSLHKLAFLFGCPLARLVSCVSRHSGVIALVSAALIDDRA